MQHCATFWHTLHFYLLHIKLRQQQTIFLAILTVKCWSFFLKPNLQDIFSPVRHTDAELVTQFALQFSKSGSIHPARQSSLLPPIISSAWNVTYLRTNTQTCTIFCHLHTTFLLTRASSLSFNFCWKQRTNLNAALLREAVLVLQQQTNSARKYASGTSDSRQHRPPKRCYSHPTMHTFST